MQKIPVPDKPVNFPLTYNDAMPFFRDFGS